MSTLGEFDTLDAQEIEAWLRHIDLGLSCDPPNITYDEVRVLRFLVTRRTAERDAAKDDLRLLAQEPEAPADLELRRLLWIRHGCGFGALYGDDGKMDCNSCGIDFLHDSPQQIRERWEKLGHAALEKAAAETPALPAAPSLEKEKA